MEVLKINNYKTFAEILKKKTNCEVKIKLIAKDHIHYQLSKDGISLGVLCVKESGVDFAPFATHETEKNEMYFNVMYMPMLEDFIEVLKVFKELFVCNEEV